MSYTKASLRERIKDRIMAETKGGNAGQWSATEKDCKKDCNL
jgi:hypothetical protein